MFVPYSAVSRQPKAGIVQISSQCTISGNCSVGVVRTTAATYTDKSVERAIRASVQPDADTRSRKLSSDLEEGPVQDSMITTAFELPGYVVVRNLGVVRGITVRSRSIVGNFLGGLQSLFGGNITIYTDLCEQARSETYDLMCQHAGKLGANAVIGLRYDATELMAGLTEVLCYGTAVFVEPRDAGTRV